MARFIRLNPSGNTEETVLVFVNVEKIRLFEPKETGSVVYTESNHTSILGVFGEIGVTQKPDAIQDAIQTSSIEINADRCLNPNSEFHRKHHFKDVVAIRDLGDTSFGRRYEFYLQNGDALTFKENEFSIPDEIVPSIEPVTEASSANETTFAAATGLLPKSESKPDQKPTPKRKKHPSVDPRQLELTLQ